VVNKKYVIHPAIGVARVGNSIGLRRGDFFLAPDKIGSLPIECDVHGDEEKDGSGNFVRVTKFKDLFGAIKRQGQKFCVYEYDEDEDADQTPKKVVLGRAARTDEVSATSIKWTVHLANKKSVWYEYSELKGNLLLGSENSYAKQGVPFRNQQVPDRQKLIIDPGPIKIEQAKKYKEIKPENAKEGYSISFPKPEDFGKTIDDIQGTYFDKLGDLITDSQGNLTVLGGHGKAWGLTDLAGYGGGDYWFDDISDGYVTCEIEISHVTHTLEAWVIVGPPDVAPEISNISSWDDTAFDVAVRKLGLVPALFTGNNFVDTFVPDYKRDILPIINRISRYQWVANVQSMTAFSSSIFEFDFSKPWGNQTISQQYFEYFRTPEIPDPDKYTYSSGPRQVSLFSNQEKGDGETTGLPLMPLNSGSNSVKNINIEKFVALTKTQNFLMEKWFCASCDPGTATEGYPLSDLDRGSIGNVVGLPQCPGIEVTWTTQNEAIYETTDKCTIIENKLYQIRIKHATVSEGLSPSRDECEKEGSPTPEYKGCEPGDLTKRMAVPWQADYYNCSIQSVNYTNPNTNKVLDEDANLVPKPPTYYTYWWPPQAPWNVINGLNLLSDSDRIKVQENSFGSEMAGLQMNYQRGINSYSQMVNQGWAALGFIRNANVDEKGKLVEYAQEFPYFVETERNYDKFDYKLVSYQDLTGNEEDQDGEFVITSITSIENVQESEKTSIRQRLEDIESAKQQQRTTFAMAGETEEKPIAEVEASLRASLQAVESFRKIKVTRKPGEVPRSGRRIRF